MVFTSNQHDVNDGDNIYDRVTVHSASPSRSLGIFLHGWQRGRSSARIVWVSEPRWTAKRRVLTSLMLRVRDSDL